MPISFTGPTGGEWSIGALIAIIVLMLSIVFMCIDKPLTPMMILGLIAALAVSRLTWHMKANLIESIVLMFPVKYRDKLMFLDKLTMDELLVL